MEKLHFTGFVNAMVFRPSPNEPDGYIVISNGFKDEYVISAYTPHDSMTNWRTVNSETLKNEYNININNIKE